MNELALFAGAGGGILGGSILGWRTRCAVELDADCRRVLLRRQKDGHLPRFPIWDDIKTFDGKPWRGSIDVVSGGFPCQDISAAGSGRGLKGERSGLWVEMARVVREVRPSYVFVENAPTLTSRGLGVVLGDLAKLGFDAEWGVIGAYQCGAPHLRKRIWILGSHPDRRGCEKLREQKHGDIKGQRRDKPYRLRKDGWWLGSKGNASHTNSKPVRHTEQWEEGGWDDLQDGRISQPNNDGPTWRVGRHGPAGSWWEAEPSVGRVAHGVARRVDRLRAIGNGQVPVVAAVAFEMLKRRLLEHGAT